MKDFNATLRNVGLWAVVILSTGALLGGLKIAVEWLLESVGLM